MSSTRDVRTRMAVIKPRDRPVCWHEDVETLVIG